MLSSESSTGKTMGWRGPPSESRSSSAFTRLIRDSRIPACCARYSNPADSGSMSSNAFLMLDSCSSNCEIGVPGSIATETMAAFAFSAESSIEDKGMACARPVSSSKRFRAEREMPRSASSSRSDLTDSRTVLVGSSFPPVDRIPERSIPSKAFNISSLISFVVETKSRKFFSAPLIPKPASVPSESSNS